MASPVFSSEAAATVRGLVVLVDRLGRLRDRLPRLELRRQRPRVLVGRIELERLGQLGARLVRLIG